MRTHRAKRHSHRGLTLIEVLIVIAILLAIGGLVYMNLMPAKEGADRDTQRIQIKQIESALDLFKLHLNRYPTQEEGLLVLNDKQSIQDETEAARWQGPYLKEVVVKDKWNHDLVYRFPGELRGEEYVDIISLGPDGQADTPDDITNHDGRKNADGEVASNEPEGFAAPEATKSSTGSGS